MDFLRYGDMFACEPFTFPTRTSRAGTQLLLEHGCIEVTAHFQHKISLFHFQQGSVTLPVLQSTPTHEFIRLATSKLPVFLQSKKFILFHNERILSSGTLAENGIRNKADVYLVEDKPVLIKFAYHSGNGRTRLFSVEAPPAVTIRSLKDHLARTLSTECPPMDTTNHVFEISDKQRVLPDDFHPVQSNSPSTEDYKTYTVHLLSKDEEYIRMKLLFPSNQRNSFTKTVLFVPENSTFGQLRNEVARVTSFPLESVFIRPLLDEVSGDDEYLSMVFQEEGLFNLSHASLDDPITNYLDLCLHDCILLAKEEPPFALQVRADVHGMGEVSLLRLKVHSYDTTGTVVKAIADKMAVDPKLVRFSSNISLAGTILEQGWTDGDMIKVDVFPRGSTITVFHKDEAFRYDTFVKDTATTKARELQLVVERKHSFRPDSVCLYHQGQLLDPDASLSSAGVGMDSAIMVSTKKPGEAGADPNQALATSGTPRSQAARAPSTKQLTTFRKRLMKNRLFPKQRPPKRPKLASQTSQSSQGNDIETSTGSKALVVRAARSVIAAEVSDIQLQNTTHSEEATSVREGSNTTGAFRFISPMGDVEQTTSEAGDESGMRLARMPSEINSGFNRLEMNLQGALQQIQRSLTGMLSMCRASAGPLLAVEHAPHPTTQVVEDRLLRQIAEGLGHEWGPLCLELGVASEDLDRIKHNHQDLWDQAYQGLKRWKMIKGGQATKQALERALRAKKLNQLADMIGV